jgi:hypothetical protein
MLYTKPINFFFDYIHLWNFEDPVVCLVYDYHRLIIPRLSLLLLYFEKQKHLQAEYGVISSDNCHRIPWNQSTGNFPVGYQMPYSFPVIQVIFLRNGPNVRFNYEAVVHSWCRMPGIPDA